MEIVFLETISLGDDIDLSRFDELGHVTKYTDTPIELVPERVKDADVVVVNKIPMNETWETEKMRGMRRKRKKCPYHEEKRSTIMMNIGRNRGLKRGV